MHNAVLKAAMMAADEPGPDADKAIHQRHFEEGIREVIAGRRVMRQTVAPAPEARPPGDAGAPLILALAALLFAIVALVVAVAGP